MKLNANGSGAISQDSSTAIAIGGSGSLTLSSGSGIIGSVVNAFQTDVGNLSVNTSSNVYISDSISVSISAPSTGAVVSIVDTANNGSVTVANSLTASGPL